MIRATAAHISANTQTWNCLIIHQFWLILTAVLKDCKASFVTHTHTHIVVVIKMATVTYHGAVTSRHI